MLAGLFVFQTFNCEGFGQKAFKIFSIFVLQKNSIMKTATKKASPKAAENKTNEKETPKKISKTWLAFEKIIGSGKIVDMRAVLK